MTDRKQQDDKAQSKRFIEKAKEIKADEKAFDRVFRKIVPPRSRNKAKIKQNSD